MKKYYYYYYKYFEKAHLHNCFVLKLRSTTHVIKTATSLILSVI